jgi:hypothetical protein
VHRHYCWRCKCEVPMLDEIEWAHVSPYLEETLRAVKAYRADTGAGLIEAKRHVADQACDAFERLTGYKETNYLAIYHHRLLHFGPPCHRCGNLLRTPRARFCAACGAVAGTVASA